MGLSGLMAGSKAAFVFGGTLLGTVSLQRRSGTGQLAVVGWAWAQLRKQLAALRMGGDCTSTLLHISCAAAGGGEGSCPSDGGGGGNAALPGSAAVSTLTVSLRNAPPHFDLQQVGNTAVRYQSAMRESGTQDAVMHQIKPHTATSTRMANSVPLHVTTQ